MGSKYFIKTFMQSLRFWFICNDRIGKDLLWRDGLHLTDEGTSFLATNFLNFLNSYHEHGNLANWQSILCKPMNAKPETQNTTFMGASKLHNDCISRFKIIRAENFDNIILGTLDINSILL